MIAFALVKSQRMHMLRRSVKTKSYAFVHGKNIAASPRRSMGEADWLHIVQSDNMWLADISNNTFSDAAVISSSTG